jgi:hypothetical protein
VLHPYLPESSPAPRSSRLLSPGGVRGVPDRLMESEDGLTTVSSQTAIVQGIAGVSLRNKDLRPGVCIR